VSLLTITFFRVTVKTSLPLVMVKTISFSSFTQVVPTLIVISFKASTLGDVINKPNETKFIAAIMFASIALGDIVIEDKDVGIEFGTAE
jgi:hypothetical protein